VFANIVWRETLSRVVLLTLGSLLYALAVNLFYAPAEIAPSGVSGIAVILNNLIGTPIGLMILIGNIPIQLLAYRMLGGWSIVARTVYVLVVYSLAIDLLTPYFPAGGITGDKLLNTLYGGILGGVAGGLIYRAGGTLGGTSTLARILQNRLGTSLNSTYLYTDSLVVILAGLIFGWEGALYAMIAIFVDGATADYILEGPSTIRTATIITNRPREVADAIIDQLQRGVTGWEGEGMYTEQPRTVLFVTVTRPEINELRALIFTVDPTAFIVIGQGHTAYGRGFRVPN
jgi:uncharacterized membrane-anchored protein YitT (DUF2179 family)